MSVLKTRSQENINPRLDRDLRLDYMILWILRNDYELFFTTEKGGNLNHLKYFEQPLFSVQQQFEGFSL